jgi:integrase/recombinase XerD
MDIDDLDAPLIGAFLNHMEGERGGGIRAPNARLTDIRSLSVSAVVKTPAPDRSHVRAANRAPVNPARRTEPSAADERGVPA